MSGIATLLNRCIQTTILLVVLAGSEAKALPDAEVIHWWATGGDADAVSVLVTEYEKHGGQWLDSAEKNYQQAREQVISRLAKGYPPTAMQWNAGLEPRQFSELGFLNTAKIIAPNFDWTSKISSSVLDITKTKDDFVGIPVNIHGENWLWTNREVFNRLKLDVPTSWDEFFSVAEQLASAGVSPLAAGSEDWQLRILFNTVILGAGGPDAYLGLYRDIDASVLDTTEFQKAISYFLQLRKFGEPATKGSTWTYQIEAVATGEAAMTVMGDWAKGEFYSLGKRLGIDFDCHLAPDTQDHYIFVSDIFIFGRNDDPDEILVQKKLSETMLDRNVQLAFNAVKGSIPARRDIDPGLLDRCGQKAHSQMELPGAPMPSISQYTDGQFGGALQRVIETIWSTPSMDTRTATALIRTALKKEVDRREKATGMAAASRNQ